MSGTPAVALANPAPLMYTAGKPQRSTRRAVAALNAPGIAMHARAIARRNRVDLRTVFTIGSFSTGHAASDAWNASIPNCGHPLQLFGARPRDVFQTIAEHVGAEEVAFFGAELFGMDL